MLVIHGICTLTLTLKKLRIFRERLFVLYIVSLNAPIPPTQLMLANNIPLLKTRIFVLHSLINREISLDPTIYVTPLSTRRTHHDQPNALTPYFARTNTYIFTFFPRSLSEWVFCDKLANFISEVRFLCCVSLYLCILVTLGLDTLSLWIFFVCFRVCFLH